MTAMTVLVMLNSPANTQIHLYLAVSNGTVLGTLFGVLGN